jgi:two-component system sensor histidine kinase CpxA
MNRLKIPLYSKILLWFLVNLLVLALLGLFYVRVIFKPGLDWLLDGPPGSRLELLSNYLGEQLRTRPQSEWPSVIDHFDEFITHPQGNWQTIFKGYRADKSAAFTLFGADGRQVFGRAVEVPDEVRRKLIDKRQAEPRPRPSRRGDAPPGQMQPPKPRFIIRSSDPARYWAGIHMDLSFEDEKEARWLPLTMVIISSDVTAGGLLFDWRPWVVVLLMGVGISALLWLPVVGGITRAIRRINDASKRIAAGQFDMRLPDTRGDELGELSTSVNTMAAQLGDYVAQQRRITADVAHELCSPIARMQMALGVVEQRSTPDQATYLKKLDNELQHMARLVEEVLAFSKAATLPERETAETFDLRELIDQVIAREAPECEIQVIVEDMKLHTLRSALDRALGNVLRNAVRYAKDIEIHAKTEDGSAIIQVLDQGPGVPADSLERLFEPFYRPEAARGRNTGGSGLGLAITKRCIDACGGKVTASNREGGGLAVEFVIQSM